MPYIDGKRVSNEEWTERYGSTKKLYTGPDGENPAPGPAIDEETGTVKVVGKGKGKTAPTKAGGNRSAKSAKATKAAIADALGVKDDSKSLDDIDVSGLDAPAADGKDGDGDEDTDVSGPEADTDAE